jgi:hypothetical protein
LGKQLVAALAHSKNNEGVSLQTSATVQGTLNTRITNMSGALLILAGAMMALTFFAMMGRINMRRFLGYATWIDVFFTIIMFWLFAHTFSGVVAGSVAGLCMAAGLTLLRKTMGYERIQRKGLKFIWVSTPPSWTVRKAVLYSLEKVGA